MSTVIHFECRSTTHLATRSRDGVGGIVLHHGTFGYCDGFASDGDHRWVPTGGVFLELLIRREGDDHSDDTRYVPHAIGIAGPLHIAR
jgi:hypothetical protein